MKLSKELKVLKIEEIQKQYLSILKERDLILNIKDDKEKKEIIDMLMQFLRILFNRLF